MDIGIIDGAVAHDQMAYTFNPPQLPTFLQLDTLVQGAQAFRWDIRAESEEDITRNTVQTNPPVSIRPTKLTWLNNNRSFKKCMVWNAAGSTIMSAISLIACLVAIFLSRSCVTTTLAITVPTTVKRRDGQIVILGPVYFNAQLSTKLDGVACVLQADMKIQKE